VCGGVRALYLGLNRWFGSVVVVFVGFGGDMGILIC
jgi:hypothetical protein